MRDRKIGKAVENQDLRVKLLEEIYSRNTNFWFLKKNLFNSSPAGIT